jgi:very-short-patch-repair endonuclease
MQTGRDAQAEGDAVAVSAKRQRDLEGEFLARWEFHGGPALERQYVFCPGRKWAFDFAHPATQVAVEIDGGTWAMGRHSRGAGFDADSEKLNSAVGCGWSVFRLTGTMLTRDSGHWIPFIIDTIEKLSSP